MGFYPVCPGNGDYILGTPVFEKVTIHLENGKDFVIKAASQQPSDFYVQSVQLNNKPYTPSYLLHKMIMHGGELQFSLGAQPNYQWG
jgi:putative alpha-1,2-mannosidase